MATACESDSDVSVETMSSLSAPYGLHANDGSISCIGGIHPKTWCCNGFIGKVQSQTKGVDKECRSNWTDSSICQEQAIPNTVTEFDQSGISLMVSLLSEYYNYIEVIQQELSSSSIDFERLLNSVQYLPCQTKKLTKHCVFNQSTPLAQSSDIKELFSNIKDISSWYNHGLITHLSKLHLDNNNLLEQYDNTISARCNDILLLLPSVSAGPSCPKTFEELKMYTRGQPDTFTLGEVIQLHNSLCEIIGLKSLVVLFQGIAKARMGSMLTFWIPSSLGTYAISNAADGVNKMTEAGIMQIEGIYNTVISAPFTEFTSLRDTTDSGYGTHIYSTSETDNDNSRSTILEDEKDDVFLTAVSPDSSNSARYSIDVSHQSDGSEVSVSVRQCSTPVIEPPPGYTGTTSIESSQDPLGSSTTSLDLYPAPPKNGLNIDLEILHEIERQNSVSAQEETPDVIPPDHAPKLDDGNYISMASAPAKVAPPPPVYTTVVRAEVVSPSHTASDVPLSPYLRRPVFRQPSRVESSYWILDASEDCGFVKRLLLRASEDRPANLHVVSIAYQQGSSKEDLLHIEQGERLTGLYLKGDLVRVSNSLHNTGYIPYTSCRISVTYYGKKSKVFQLAHSHLYNMSTVNVQQVVDTSDGFREFNPIRVDFVVIRSYVPLEKDEMMVRVGEHIRALYCDKSWIYGSLGNERAGFIPRGNCRLTRGSHRALQMSGWLLPKHPFQSDFIFNSSLPPPEFLLENERLPKAGSGQIRMITRNYVIPGTQYIAKRGVNVKTIYSEGNMFRFVANIAGYSFWVPSAFTVLSPAVQVLPFQVPHPNNESIESPVATDKGEEGVKLRRPRAHTIGAYDVEKHPKKKVSFAAKNEMAIINSVRSSLCQSNPELSVLDTVDCSEKDPMYDVIPARRVKSNENMFNMILMDESPTSFCGGKFFCF